MIAKSISSTPAPAVARRPSSPRRWWWLLPPVRLLLSSRRRDDSRRAFLASLPAEDLALITRFINIARGWVLVGLGAWLIALKETYELVEHYECALLVHWLLVVVMTLVAIGIVGTSTRRETKPRR